MFSILPCKDKERLSAFPEGTTLLIYSENGAERGHIAYRVNMSAYEIVSMDTGEKDMSQQETLLHADALVRAVGSIALTNSVLTLCTKLTYCEELLTKLGFFRNGDFYTLYLHKLFSKGCSGCSGCK